MSLLETENITISRVDGAYVKGQWEANAPVVTGPVKVNIQPITGEELLQLPESDRDKTILKIYSKSEIRVSDKITRAVDGLNYKVLTIRNWTVFNIPHSQGMIALNNT